MQSSLFVRECYRKITTKAQIVPLSQSRLAFIDAAKATILEASAQ